MTTLRSQALDWLDVNAVSLVFTVVVVVACLILNTLIARLISRADQRESQQAAVLKVIQFALLLTGFFDTDGRRIGCPGVGSDARMFSRQANVQSFAAVAWTPRQYSVAVRRGSPVARPRQG